VEKDSTQVPFVNPKIKRSLKVGDLRVVLDFMKQEGYGSWDDEEKTVFSCSWKKMDEWANLIYNWAISAGVVGKLLTFFDVHGGDASADQPFHGLNPGLLLKVLLLLEDQGKARVFQEGKVVDEFGVRFYEMS